MLSLWVLSNDRGFYRLLCFVPQLILYHSVLNHYRMTPCVIPFARSLGPSCIVLFALHVCFRDGC